MILIWKQSFINCKWKNHKLQKKKKNCTILPDNEYEYLINPNYKISNEIAIKPAGKGSIVAVMISKYYQTMCQSHLNN